MDLKGTRRDIFRNKITGQHISIVVAALKRGSVTLDGLDVSCNIIGDDGVSALATLLEPGDHFTPTVRTINVRSNSITSDGACVLVNALATSDGSGLKQLNMNGNDLGDVAGIACARMLEVNGTLESLDVGNAGLGTDAIIALATVLSSNNTLRHLSLENPRLFSKTEDTTYHLCKMLRVNGGLVSLNLAKNGIGDYGAKLLGEYLDDNSTLRVLNLRCNNIGSAGAGSLAALLLRGSPIQILDVSANRICDSGAHALAVPVRRGCGLEYLDARGCGIGDAGLTALADALTADTRLRRLCLWDNDFGESAKASFAKVCSSVVPVAKLELDFRTYSSESKIPSASGGAPVSMQELFVARVELNEVQL
jgi:Ran GTPase-activating protein (RanGAP) involved in mRNA processing and transport